MKFVKGSIITNTIASQAAEIIAILGSGYLYYLVGPKISFACAFLLATLGSSLLLVFWNHLNLIPIFIAREKFGAAGAFNLTFVSSV